MWIDIKDKSKWPTNDEVQVILGALQEDGSMYAEVGRLYPESGKIKFCRCCSWIEGVTHWMPIPKLKE